MIDERVVAPSSRVFPLWRSVAITSAALLVMAATCIGAGVWYRGAHARSAWRSAVIQAPCLLHADILLALEANPAIAGDAPRIRESIQSGYSRWTLNADVAGGGWLLNPDAQAWTWEPADLTSNSIVMVRADPIESRRLPPHARADDRLTWLAVDVGGKPSYLTHSELPEWMPDGLLLSSLP